MITTLEEYEASIAQAISDPDLPYPANHFAFQHIREAIGEAPMSIVEVGVGSGGAIPLFAGLGHRFAGLDSDPASVSESRRRMSAIGLEPGRIIEADIREPHTYEAAFAQENFDVLIAMGVLPHVACESAVLENMATLVRPGGHVFVECRNSLFSLTTFNRYTHEFVMDTLLEGVSAELRSLVDGDIRQRVEMGIPSGGTSTSRFHVPFEILALAQNQPWEGVEILPFHFHAGMPFLEASNPVAFRRASVELETVGPRWRGWLLASAFLLHFQTPAAR